MIMFEGVTVNGDFIFNASVFFPSIGDDWKQTAFKVIAYEDGVIEIAVDCAESISRVAELVSGMFSRKSNFSNLDSVILNYCNIRLQIGRSTGRKNIICMVMKEMSTSDYRNSDNEVFVDIRICQKQNPLKDLDGTNMKYELYNNSFYFDEIVEWSKSLWFRSIGTGKCMCITSLKKGIATVEGMPGVSISEFVSELRKFFIPYSNFYGIRAIEVEFNQFSIKIDEQNAGRIMSLYRRSCDMSNGLWEKEIQEYYNSPQYVRDHAKSLKKENRKKTVIQKVRQFQKRNVDFSIDDEEKKEKWKKCKSINSEDGYSKGIIDYTILWAQYMEYLMDKHDKKLSDVWEISSRLSDIYGITGFMYGCAVNILSSVWKYGEELRVQHNSKYNHNGEWVVNPAVLTISV